MTSDIMELDGEMIKYLHCSECGRTSRWGERHGFHFCMNIDTYELESIRCLSKECERHSPDLQSGIISVFELPSEHDFHQIYDTFISIDIDHNFKSYLENDPGIEFEIPTLF